MVICSRKPMFDLTIFMVLVDVGYFIFVGYQRNEWLYILGFKCIHFSVEYKNNFC